MNFKTNEAGVRINCVFHREINKVTSECTALIDFYNCADTSNLCGRCPFFKTREQYIKGMKNGRGAA